MNDHLCAPAPRCPVCDAPPLWRRVLQRLRGDQPCSTCGMLMPVPPRLRHGYRARPRHDWHPHPVVPTSPGGASRPPVR